MIRRLSLVLVLLLAAALVPLSALGSETQPEGAGLPPGPARASGTPAAQPAPGLITSSAPLTVDPAIYDDTADGRTGRFLVLLRSQADVKAAAARALAESRAGDRAHPSAARDRAAWLEQGRAVLDAVRSAAAAAQPAVTAQLDALGATYRSYYVANLLAVEGERRAVDALAARPDVLAIESNREFRVPLEGGMQDSPPPPILQSPAGVEWNVSWIHAPELWAMGYYGQGVVVANADTGVQWDHPALINQYRGKESAGINHNYNWWDAIKTPIVGGSSCEYDSPFPCDDDGHGTHTTGIAIGDDGAGDQIGVAPGAKWIACRNMDNRVGRPNTYIECLQFFLAPTDLTGQNPRPDLRADVVSNSYGCPPDELCAPNSLHAVVETLRAAGVFMAVSAGNDGPACSSINEPPGTEASVITVGATGSQTDAIASYSSRGPVTIDGGRLRKPDVVAPGSGVVSSVPGNGYGSKSGTSMAAPHLAGAVALLWSAAPGLRGNVSLTQEIFQDSARRLTTSETCGGTQGQVPNNTYGYGMIDVPAAYLMAQTIPIPTLTPTPTATPTPTPTATPPRVEIWLPVLVRDEGT